jgi:hypothetical protein
MKVLKNLAMICAIAFMTSCSSTAKFPVSQIVPVADITAKTHKQSKTNYLVTLTANNLAAVERLSPEKKYYVIWVVSKSGVTRNVGYFTPKNAVKSTYKASFPYKPMEIFITAEDEEGFCEPAGIEISRTKL